MKNIFRIIAVLAIILLVNGCAYTIETANGRVSRSALSIGVPPPVTRVVGGGYYAPAPAYGYQGYGYPGYYAPPIGWAWSGGYFGSVWSDGHHHHHHDDHRDGDTVNNFNNDGDVNIGDNSNFNGAEGDEGGDEGGDGGNQ